MMGAILEINMYLDNHLSLLSDISLGIEPPDAEICLSGCSLLPDYYVRTGTESLENVPQIKAELQRIWSDYDFVCSETTWEQTAERVKNYKTLDILQL